MEKHSKNLPGHSRAKADRSLPAGLRDIELWQTNRRTFLKAALLAGGLSQLAFLESCSGTPEDEGNELLTGKQVKTLKSILLKLFPNDGNGPSAEDLHSYEYILWTLRDPGANQDDNNYIIDGMDWIDESAQELFAADYHTLDEVQKDQALTRFMQYDYGRDWCSILLTFILESLLMDPIYGANPDGVGWKWLNHTPGFPPASEALRYENILKTVRADY